MNVDFKPDPTWYFEDERREQAVEALTLYFNNFLGSWFEHFADKRHPNSITERDILAVSMLSVNIPPGTTIWLLGEGRGQVSGLLSRIPQDQKIWDPGTDLSKTSAAWQLWELLRTHTWPNDAGATGMGETKISKLLAVKRPELIPIQDKLVREALFADGKVSNYWSPWQRLHQSAKGLRLRNIADELRTEAKVSDAVPVLRIIDVVIWSWADRDRRQKRVSSRD